MSLRGIRSVVLVAVRFSLLCSLEWSLLCAVLVTASEPCVAQRDASPQGFSRQDELHGSISPGREWWDELHYDLALRVFPETKKFDYRPTAWKVTYRIVALKSKRPVAPIWAPKAAPIMCMPRSCAGSSPREGVGVSSAPAARSSSSFGMAVRLHLAERGEIRRPFHR